MDVLTRFLERSGLRGQVFCRTQASAPWGLRMPPAPQVGLHIATRGACWLRLGDERPPIRLFRGDVVLLPHGDGHGLADDPASNLQSFSDWKAHHDERHRLIRASNGGGDVTHLICGAYRFLSGAQHPLVRLLPSVIHIQAEDRPAGLERALNALRDELDQPDVGSGTIVSRLLDVLLVEILRAWLSHQPEGSTGWLGALRDPAIATVLAALHDTPAAAWTVQELAQTAGLSRAVLARRFREKVGTPPLTYLSQVRMDLAARLLRTTEQSLTEISRQVGYNSEFAFNRAFKQAYGQPPGQFRKETAAAP